MSLSNKSHRSGSVTRIASAIEPKRRRLGLSSRELASLCGLSHSTVLAIENGSERISPPTITKVALALLAYDDSAPKTLVRPRRLYSGLAETAFTGRDAA
jgi:transcriptional regulator with XRE-family HTH domain